MRLTRAVFKAIYYNTKCLLRCMSFVIFLYQTQKQLNLRDDKLPFIMNSSRLKAESSFKIKADARKRRMLFLS